MSSMALEVLTELSFIANITPKHKINVKNSSVTSSDSKVGSIMRYITGESREGTINYINHVITKAIEITPKEDSTTQQSLITTMRSAIEGIRHLKITYEDDVFFTAKLSAEIMRIEHFIEWALDNLNNEHRRR